MIEFVEAKKILDSRKKPTVGVEIRTQKGMFFGSCPSGASTGENEAKALDAEKAIDNVNNIIAPKLLGESEVNQKKIDKIMIELDGTPDKSKLGANAILPVSIAVCRAGAAKKNLPLYKYISKIYRDPVSMGFPRGCFNIINGGAHTDNDLDIQEFMIVPGYNSFSENFGIGKKVFENLKKILEKELGEKGIAMGDEGGFAPPISDPEKALDYIMEAIGNLRVDIGLDVAATQIENKEKYNIDFYKSLIKKYPIIFIEDPFAEKDDKGFKTAVRELGKVIIVGDDYLTTNIKRIRRAKEKNSCTGVIIKPNQIGAITETLKAVKLAKYYGWKTVVSHRSGETMDDFIADLAVGVGSDFIKSGAPSKPERLAKYNRLTEIEKEL